MYKNFISDEEIIELYWKRDETAITANDNKYGKLLFEIAYNILCDKYECDECKNDTYFGIWNAIPPERPLFFKAYTVKMMRYIAINRYKKNTSKKRVPSHLTIAIDELEFALRSNESVEKDKELGRLISEYLRGISQHHRYIFISRFYIANSVDAIAKELGVSSSSVYKSIEKTKKGLQAYLERKGVYI